MKILRDIRDKFYYVDNKAKWIVWILLGLIFLFILYLGIFRNDSYYSKFFYPDIKSQKLIVEKRLVIKKPKVDMQVQEIVEELIVGPISPDIHNPFPKESKLLSCWIIDNVAYLDFNNEMVLNIGEKISKLKNGYHLFLESIVDTICFKYKQIRRVKFFFDGREYSYFGKYSIKGDINSDGKNNSINNGIKPDWTVLRK